MATAAVFLTLSLVGAACGGNDGKDEVKTSSSSTSSTVAGGSTTTSTVDPSASTTTVADEGTSPTTQVPGPGTTAAPVVTAPPATPPPGPVALTPPAPGLYSYATSGQTTITPALIPPIPYPPVSTNRVDPAAGTRQHMLRNLQDGAGNGSLVDYIFDYRPDGVYLESLRFTVTFSGQSNVQDLTPPAPLLFLATGAGPGASRTLTIPTGGGSAQVVVDVPRTEPVIIGGRSIDTLVVRSVATLPAGAVTGTQTLTVNLDPASRLWLKESGTGDATAVTGFGTFRVQSQYGATIESITPR